VFLSDERSLQIVPDATSNRCRVVIEGCNTGVVYKVKVAAIPPGDFNSIQSLYGSYYFVQ